MSTTSPARALKQGVAVHQVRVGIRRSTETASTQESAVAKTLTLSPRELREQLMAPRAIERVHALHALECEIGHAPADVARELQAFTARGIPFYAPADPAYLKWVDKAVAYCERVHIN